MVVLCSVKCTTITLEAEPTKEGYTFSGWSSVPATMPAEDVLVEGSFIINKYMVTYNVDGVYYATDSIEYEAEIVPIEVPAKEGHTFSWTDLPSTMPAHDIVVNGAYTANSYYLIYKVDGVEYKRISVVYGTTITLEVEPEKEGYTFSGWSEVPTTMPAEDVVVEGNFIANVYELIYFVDDELFATDSVTYGEKIVLREEPIKNGHVFSGWSEVPETMPAHNVEVTGIFILTVAIDDVNISDMKKVKKVLIDDKIYIILPDGTKYSITGQIVRD